MKSLHYHMDSKNLKSKHLNVKPQKNIKAPCKKVPAKIVMNEKCDSLCHGPSDSAVLHSFEQPYDWIEEEMARVCGIGMENEEPSLYELKSPVVTNSLSVVEVASSELKSCGPTIVSLPHSVGKPVDQINAYSYWQKLRIKNEEDLERKLKRIAETKGIEKRARLEKRFIQLFGSDNDSTISRVTEKFSGRKDRDEIVALTVNYLMPFYKAQKIASRDLFKKLAKHISDYVMKEFSYPDEEDVQIVVQGLFRNGRTINSEEDITSKGK